MNFIEIKVPVMKKSIFFIFPIICFLFAGPAFAIGKKPYQFDMHENPFVVKINTGLNSSPSYEEDTYYTSGPLKSDTIRIRSERDRLSETEISVEAIGQYFWTDHISFSASIGYRKNQTQTSKSGLSGYTDSGQATLIPVTGTVQYYFAPYGAIRPYIGAGYHYTKFINGYDYIQYSNSSGPILQAGLDWWYNVHWGVNFDIKKMWASTERDASKLHGLSEGSAVHNIDYDPLTISLGLAYRF